MLLSEQSDKWVQTQAGDSVHGWEQCVDISSKEHSRRVGFGQFVHVTMLCNKAVADSCARTYIVVRVGLWEAWHKGVASGCKEMHMINYMIILAAPVS